MRVLVALGGNAMTSADGSASPEAQIAAISKAMEPVAELVSLGHEVVLTHGNGPQVGNLLVKNELAASVVPPVPLDWCGAQTQATVGFVVLDTLEVALRRRGLRRPAAALVTRTLVDRDDPGFTNPTKPIGRYLPQPEAQVLVDHGQTWQDRGERGWRRVVASPEPLEILDADSARALVDAGYVVVAGGGGGIPCVRDPDGSVRGVEAVIDKDLSAAVLGRALDVDVLVIATDVEAVATGWGTPAQRELGVVSVAELRDLAAAGEFASGSMGPKVEAVCRFVEAGGTRAAICALDRIAAAALGEAGTVVRPSAPSTEE
ncbi:carbamate kinase [Angustibacter sp. McL0619]|uniref:carbamate kinase n=1 Tax=Angustibacter sp. McL0619 TaxID=3415676 RepID=UPI003CE7CC32